MSICCRNRRQKQADVQTVTLRTCYVVHLRPLVLNHSVQTAVISPGQQLPDGQLPRNRPRQTPSPAQCSEETVPWCVQCVHCGTVGMSAPLIDGLDSRLMHNSLSKPLNKYKNNWFTPDVNRTGMHRKAVSHTVKCRQPVHTN